jgi:hypothetical protein
MNRISRLHEYFQDQSPLNEDNLSGLANAHPWQEIEKMGTRLVKGEPIQLTANLFGTGVDRIDPTSTQFQDTVQLLRWLFVQNYVQNKTADADLLIKGSASAVGSSSGYDNFALAARRSKNLVDALKIWFNKNKPRTDINTKGEFVNLDWATLTKYLKISQDAIVGKATKKGSPEASAEQCVLLMWVPLNQEKTFKYDMVQPIDNTATVVKPQKPLIKIPDPDPILVEEELVKCGCCGREFTPNDKKSWVMKRYKWSLNELKNGWLKNRTGLDVFGWLVGMSKK